MTHRVDRKILTADRKILIADRKILTDRKEARVADTKYMLDKVLGLFSIARDMNKARYSDKTYLCK